MAQKAAPAREGFFRPAGFPAVPAEGDADFSGTTAAVVEAREQRVRQGWQLAEKTNALREEVRQCYRGAFVQCAGGGGW